MSKKNAMQEKLKEYKTKRNALTPTEALNQPLEEPTEEVVKEITTDISQNKSVGISDITEPVNTITGNQKMQNLLNKKKKVEDTHTRRTFLVRNDLLSRLDSYAKKIGNSGFKTEFINIVIEEGLAELEGIKDK